MPTLRHNKSFDEKTGYRARSMLTVPMLSAMSEVIGVVQLINKKRDPKRPLAADGADDDNVIPFDERAEELALALAAQAGISLENAHALRRDPAAVRRLRRRLGDRDRVARSRRRPAIRGGSRR